MDNQFNNNDANKHLNPFFPLEYYKELIKILRYRIIQGLYTKKKFKKRLVTKIYV